MYEFAYICGRVCARACMCTLARGQFVRRISRVLNPFVHVRSLVVVRSLMASIKSNKSLKNFLASENSSRCDKVTNQVRKCCQCICCCCTINDVDEGLTMEDIFGSTKICMLLTVFATYFFFGIFIMISSTLLLATKALQISTPPDTDVDDEDCLNPTPDGEVDVIKILSVENSDEVGDHKSHRCRGFNGKEWDFTCFGRLQGVDFASAMSKPSEYLGLNVLMISAGKIFVLSGFIVQVGGPSFCSTQAVLATFTTFTRRQSTPSL